MKYLFGTIESNCFIMQVSVRKYSPQSSPGRNLQDLKKSYEVAPSPVSPLIRRATSNNIFSDARSPSLSVPPKPAQSSSLPPSNLSSPPLSHAAVSNKTSLPSGDLPMNVTAPSSVVTQTPPPAPVQQPMSTATLVALSRSSETTGGLVPDKQMEIMQQAGSCNIQFYYY